MEVSGQLQFAELFGFVCLDTTDDVDVMENRKFIFFATNRGSIPENDKNNNEKCNVIFARI